MSDQNSHIIEEMRGHTPGPWQLWDGCSWRRFGSQSTEETIVEPVVHRDGHPDLMIRNDADASLILAAPELLAENLELRDLVDAQRDRAENAEADLAKANQDLGKRAEELARLLSRADELTAALARAEKAEAERDELRGLLVDVVARHADDLSEEIVDRIAAATGGRPLPPEGEARAEPEKPVFREACPECGGGWHWDGTLSYCLSRCGQ